jgi:hypothetical protein
MDTLEMLRRYDRTDPVVERLATQHERNEAATPAAVKDRRVDFTRPLPAKPNQIGLAYVLLNKLRDHNPDVERTARAWLDERKDTINRADISDVITRLRKHLAAPMVAAATPAATPQRAVWAEWRALAEQLVAMGGRHGARFAVDTEHGAANTVAFWWIVPSEGPQWTRYFLRQMIGGHSEAQRVRMAPEAMVRIAHKILEAGPKESMLRYGRELGECGHCGRTLTNDASRAAGIGPVCAKGKG